MLSSLVQSTFRAVPPIHRAGYPFILGGVVVTILLWLLWGPLGWIALVLTLYMAFFFRDPVRVTPLAPGLVVAPADGRVTAVDHAVPPADLALGLDPLPRVSIFLSVLDVHVNRAPVTGRIARIAYRPGAFLNAELDKASEDNERNCLVIETPRGDVGVVQIAGFVARRIVCSVRRDEDVAIGSRFGLIRFGSRLDVYLPAGTALRVGIGQRAVGGETVIAEFGGAEVRAGFLPQ
ncbi:MAG TPA: phosphatidylserine decarboxylase [Hyphomicrobiales bacterium]|nr:phosphatidylserine decarboxylase [Hyphomicrobiales bacterium]